MTNADQGDAEAQSEAGPAGDSAILKLSPDEAIVLLEVLSRWSENPQSAPDPACFESSAECAVLHAVCSDLEGQLAAPFRSDYGQLLADARERLEPLWDDTNFSVRGPRTATGL